jgi:hypothetical protein
LMPGLAPIGVPVVACGAKEVAFPAGTIDEPCPAGELSPPEHIMHVATTAISPAIPERCGSPTS